MSNRRTAPKKKSVFGRAHRAPDEAHFSGIAPENDESDDAAPRSKRGVIFSVLKILAGTALVCGTAGALAYGAHHYALTTPRFAIRDVSVEGVHRLGRDDVLLAAGVKPGNNIFRLELEKAEAGVLQSPWVASARITRRLPGSVRVEIVEREPRALLVLPSTTFLVSADAEPFKELGPGDPHDLPLITGFDVEALARDRRAELERLEEALTLLDAYEHVSVASVHPAEELHLTETGEAILTIGSQGTALHLGKAPWKQKLYRAVRVLGKSAQSGGVPGVVFLDNEAHPERVVVRVK